MFRALLAAVVALVLAGNASAAPIIIDTFNDPVSPGQTVMSGPLTGSLASVTGAGVLNGAGTRDVSYSGVNANTIPANNFRPAGEFLSVNGVIPSTLALATFDSAIQVDLKYSGFGTLDASAQTTLDLIFNTIFDKGVNPTFDIDILLTTASGMLSGVFQAPGGFVPNGGTLQVPLSMLTGSGSLSTITQIEVRLNDNGSPSAGADFALDQLQFSAPIPEPATLATLGLMGMCGGFFVRRKLKAASVAQA